MSTDIFICIFHRIQHIAVNANTELGYAHKCNLHIIALSLLCLLARVTGNANILDYANTIVAARNEDSRHLLPPLLDSKLNHDKQNLNVPTLMLDKVRKQKPSI